MKETFNDERLNSKQVAFIGTGPLTLLKSYLLAKSNPDINITMFDSSSQIGGAWYSDQSPKGHEIECGCHIWSYVPTAYNFIETELGVKLFKWKTKPVHVKGNVQIGYPLKMTFHSYKAFFKTLFTFKWNNFKVLNKDPEICYRFFGKTNLYPKLGSPELINALREKINSLPNVTIHLNANIEVIDIGNSVQLHSQNTTYEFDHVYFTYVSRLNSLRIASKEIVQESVKIDYIHFLISVNRPLLKPISYWRLLGDPIIHRITDISYQTEFSENLLLVGIKATSYANDKEPELVEHVKHVLKSKKLIDDSFGFEKIKTHIFPTNYLSKNTLSELSKHTDQITLLHTTDLTCGVHFLLEKEKIIS